MAVPVPAPTLVSDNTIRVQPGESATYRFTDSSDARIGTLLWEVWSLLPGGTAATWNSVTTDSPPHANSVTIQTSRDTPYGYYAIGVHVKALNTCLTSPNTTNIYLKVAPKLDIFTFDGQGPLNDTTQITIAGKKVNLQVVPHDPSVFLTNPNWSIEGPAIGGYTQTRDSSSISPIDLRSLTVLFYWTVYGTTMPWNVSVKADVQLFGVDTDPAQVAYNVLGAQLTPTMFTTAAVSNSTVEGFFGLHFGADAPTGVSGQFQATAPAGGSGQINWTSVLSSAHASYTRQDGTTISIYDFDAPKVDTCPQPLPSVPISASSTSTLPFDDSPGFGFTSDMIDLRASEDFTTYFEYKPDGPDSIWVTLGTLPWRWQGYTQFVDGQWTAPTETEGTSQGPLMTVLSSDLPQWTGYITGTVPCGG